jgi:hypothetical protein
MLDLLVYDILVGIAEVGIRSRGRYVGRAFAGIIIDCVCFDNFEGVFVYLREELWAERDVLFSLGFFGRGCWFLSEIVPGALEHFVKHIAGKAAVFLYFDFGANHLGDRGGFNPVVPCGFEYFAVVVSVYFCEGGQFLGKRIGEVEMKGFKFYFVLNVGFIDGEDFFAVVGSGGF